MIIKRVALLGAGAVGSYFIWGLSDKLGDDFCVTAKGERKNRLEQNGMMINGRRCRPAVRTPEETDAPDLLLVSTKYDALDGAIEDIREIVGPDTIVMSLLNGIGSEERIGAAIGPEHVLYSLMRIASVRDGNSVTFDPELTGGVFYGEKDSVLPSERTAALEDLFEDTPIRHHFVEDIVTDQWKKYASNVSQNLPQAILGVGAGVYEFSEHVYFLAQKLWGEVAAVAAARGVHLDPEIVLFPGVRTTARYSTLQDLDAKRHTEIEMLAGEMIRMGRETGVPVPYCEYTYHLIRAMEEKNDGKFRAFSSES